MIRLACPHCDASVRLGDDYRGQRVRCPDCQGVINASQVTLRGEEETPTEPPKRNTTGLWIGLILGGAVLTIGIIAAAVLATRETTPSSKAIAQAPEPERKEEPQQIEIAPRAKPAGLPEVRVDDLPPPPQPKPQDVKPLEPPPALPVAPKPVPQIVNPLPNKPAEEPKPAGRIESSDIPEGVREQAAKELKELAEKTYEKSRKELPAAQEMLKRFKNGIVNRKATRVLMPASKDDPVNFPSEAEQKRYIAEQTKHVEKLEADIKAYGEKNWAHFAPDIYKLEFLAEIGYLKNRKLLTIEVLDGHSALIAIEVARPVPNGEPKTETVEVYLTGIPTGKLEPKLRSDFKDLLVVARQHKDGRFILVPIRIEPEIRGEK